MTSEQTNIDNLQTDSGSFSTRVTALKTDSGSFSTRVTTEEANVDTLQSTMTSEQTNIDNLQTDSGRVSTRVTALKTDSGSFSTRVTTLEALDVDDDLNFAGDSGTGTIDFDSETLTIAGGGGMSSVASGNSVTLNLDSGILSSSAQIATEISGAFEGGVGDGTLSLFSGSVSSTGSFGRVEVVNRIARTGDPDTHIYFSDDDINIQAGGVNMIDITQDTKI
jgi:hypothetical protein